MLDTMNEIAGTILPDPTAQAIYQKQYPIFVAAYHALEPVFDQIDGMG